MIDEALLKPIESFFEINFEGHEAMLACRGGNSVYDLLRKDDIVAGFSSGDKAGLLWAYEIREKGFEPLNKEFCYCFVESIAQANGVELLDGFWLVRFWDKANES